MKIEGIVDIISSNWGLKKKLKMWMYNELILSSR